MYERYGSYVNVKAYVDNWYIEDTFVPVQHENNIIEVSLSSNNYLNLTIITVFLKNLILFSHLVKLRYDLLS